jgi:hypothetical protein
VVFGGRRRNRPAAELTHWSGAIFVRTAAAGGAIAALGNAARAAQGVTAAAGGRDAWVSILRRVADPVLSMCGHQPCVGETYISTGSLYLCAVAFLPLGLPASDPFWASPSQPWTSAKAWSGETFPI